MKQQRRFFLKKAGKMSASLVMAGSMGPLLSACGQQKQPAEETAMATDTTPEDVATAPLFFQISLAQWSLNKSLFGGKMDNLDFAKVTREEFGLDGVEYVNQFFKDKATDQDYLAQMNQRADDNGVKNLLIMVDGEGLLGTLDAAKRAKAVENHYKWVEAAKTLGCHSIRVNASTNEGTAEEVAAAAAESLAKLSEFAAPENINVIVENHGSYSSDGEWLAGVIAQVNMDNCGTLPDFGNFWFDWRTRDRQFDRYVGVKAMMPYAKAVSAKAHEFDQNGNEAHTDYVKMLQIVKDAGYTGYLGIEYEGDGLSEYEGIKATRDLLIKAGGMVV